MAGAIPMFRLNVIILVFLLPLLALGNDSNTEFSKEPVATQPYSDYYDSIYTVLFEDSVRAFGFIELAEGHAKREGNLKEQARIVLIKMQYALHMGQSEKAHGFLAATKSILQRSSQPHPKEVFLMLRQTGALWRLEGKLDSAIMVLQHCLKHCKASGFKQAEGEVYLDIGFLNEQAGNFNLALSYADSGLQMARALNDTNMMANTYNQLGNVSGQMGLPRQALEYFNQALRYKAIDHRDSSEFASIYNNMSISYQELGQHKKAIQYIRKTMRLDRKYNYFPGLVTGSNNLGRTYMDMGMLDSALFFMKRAENLGKQHQMGIDVTLALSNQAYAYLKLGKLNEARSAALEALEVNVDQGFVNRSKILEALYHIEEANGAFELALDYHKQFKELDDSLMSQQSREKRDELLTAYETEKKELAIETLEKNRELNEAKLEKAALQRSYLLVGLCLSIVLLFMVGYVYLQRSRSHKLLAIKNEEIQAQSLELEIKQKQIETTLQQRELLLREVHHRVKNNLQVISSLFDLQSGSTSDSEALQALENGQNRIMSMALVHENLYQGENLALVDFKAYSEQLIKEIARSMQDESKEVACTLDIEDLMLNIDSAVPMGLIVNELVTNSFKHAFHKQPTPKIRIEMKQTPKGETLMVYKDNGSGFSDNEQLTRTKGSLGLRLIQMLARQLKGEFQIVPPSSFEILFKQGL